MADRPIHPDKPAPVCPICGNSILTPAILPGCAAYHSGGADDPIRPTPDEPDDPHPEKPTHFVVIYDAITGNMLFNGMCSYGYPFQSDISPSPYPYCIFSAADKGIMDGVHTSANVDLSDYAGLSTDLNATVPDNGFNMFSAADNKPVQGTMYAIPLPKSTATDSNFVPKYQDRISGRTPKCRDAISTTRVDNFIHKKHFEPLAHFGIDIEDNNDSSIKYHENTGTVTIAYECGSNNANKYAILFEDNGTTVQALYCNQCDDTGTVEFVIDKFSDYGIAISDNEVDIDELNAVEEQPQTTVSSNIHFGNSTLKDMFIGSTLVAKAYIGNNVVWDKTFEQWDTATIELVDNVISTPVVEGVTKYKVYSNGTYIGYVDSSNVWHSEL